MTCLSLDPTDVCYAYDGRSPLPPEVEQHSPEKREEPPEPTAITQGTRTFQGCLSYDPLDICYLLARMPTHQMASSYLDHEKADEILQSAQDAPQADQGTPLEKQVTSKEEEELKLAHYIYEELLKYEEYVSSLNAQREGEIGHTYHDPLSL